MTTELQILAATAVFTILHLVPIMIARTVSPGSPAWGLGNREGPEPGLVPWGQRALRAHSNMLENLPHFAALVLVAHVGGRANATTLLASQVFLGFRVAYLAVYLGSIPGIRTLLFIGGLLAELVIFWQIVS